MKSSENANSKLPPDLAYSVRVSAYRSEFGRREDPVGSAKSYLSSLTLADHVHTFFHPRSELSAQKAAAKELLRSRR